jgi:hypothetical protein
MHHMEADIALGGMPKTPRKQYAHGGARSSGVPKKRRDENIGAWR